MSQTPKQIALRFVFFQAVMALVFSVVIAVVWGAASAYSAAIAGFICVLANAFFAQRVFAYRGAREVKHILRAFLWGELLKLLGTAVAMVLALIYLQVAVLPFFLMYFVLQIAMWFAPMVQLGAK